MRRFAKSFAARLAIPLMLVVALSAPASPHAHDAEATGYNFAPVTALIQNAVTSIPLQGASFRVEKDRQLVYEQAFGSYTTSTPVLVASATKWLSAATIMTLVDAGLIALDAPVSTYLSRFSGEMGTMTMRQMLSHTSGLPPDGGCENNHTITLAQCVDQIAQVTPLAPPGTQFYYGGASMQVAGRVAEVVTGKSWAQIFEERIRAPLGLTSTFYYYAYAGLNPLIAGGASSTLDDYGKFLAMLLLAARLVQRR